ncbi:MAG: T9SS type A sorting domain-containing protein [Bacteroidales bacterium]|nr:T9SS type A sorting domain-containing protein [Bacteroidales bacterium]
MAQSRVGTDLVLNSIDNEAHSLFGDRNIVATVKNVGINPINSFDIQYQVNNGNTVTENVTNVLINPNEIYTYTFYSTWEATAGIYDVNVGLSNINGNRDDKMDNSSKTKSIHIASKSVANFPLFELFTSSSCPPCNGFNTNVFSPFLNLNDGRLSIIKYQMNWPGNGDPYYTAEGGTRRNYYGVQGVPVLYTGGVNTPTSAGAINNAFNSQIAKEAFFEINATANIVNSTNVFVSVDVLPHISTDNLKLHVAVVERETTGNATTNGEKKFHFVMMKMLPNANGTVFSSTDGEALNFNLSADLSTTHVEEFDDLMVVVFIQSGTKEVLQSTMVDAAMNTDDYAVTFNVLNSLDNKPVKGATITIDEDQTTTDQKGKAFMLLPNGSYSFEIAKDYFVTQSGDFDITDANTSVDIVLVPLEYTVTFTILDETTEAPIEGATITINEQSLSTDNSGIAKIDLINSEYPYTVLKSGFETVEGVVTVNNQDYDISVVLTPASGINTSTLSSLSFYPNPTHGEVTIKIPTEEKVGTVEIYSITGALVYSKQYNASLSEIKLNIDQPQGVYMVRLTLNNGETSIGKLIVK